MPSAWDIPGMTDSQIISKFDIPATIQSDPHVLGLLLNYLKLNSGVATTLNPVPTPGPATSTPAPTSTPNPTSTPTPAPGLTLSVSYLGKTRDVVGTSDGAISSDGQLDAGFTVTIPSTKTLTKLTLTESSPSGVWDTQLGNQNWFLGVATTANGSIVNTSSLNLAVSAGGSVTIFASDASPNYFATGRSLTLTATFSDGSTGTGNITIGSISVGITGDLNHDGIVNSLDWSILNSKWFTSDATADLNHDGLVNSLDFSILNSHWFEHT